jgi:TRAP-type C4-dicarboxylate transport system permease small subunit
MGLMVITAVVFWQVMVRFVLTAAGINISSPGPRKSRVTS